jgi:hypothetical protein
MSGRQLHRLAKLPLAEKLRWLEEAHDLVRHLLAQKKAPSGPDGSFDSPRRRVPARPSPSDITRSTRDADLPR